MKKYLLIAFVALSISAIQINAQEESGWLPMLEEGRMWNVVSLHPSDAENAKYKDIQGRPCEGIPYVYYVGSEQESHERIYKQIVKKDDDSVVLLRQEGAKIYMGFTDCEEEWLIYDFSMKEGDIYHFGEEMDLFVNKVDTISVGGINRRRLWMSYYSKESKENSQTLADIWIEGIGGAATSPCFTYECWTTTSSSAMESCYQNGNQLFSFCDFFSPSPVEIIRSTGKVPSQSDNAVYDLSGRRVDAKAYENENQKLKKGIYIKDGKKTVVR